MSNMAKEKFVRGSWLLEECVEDASAYYEQHKAKVDEVIDWANCLNIYVGFGTSEDGTYLCEYDVTGQTTQMCKGIAAELKALLKAEWKNVRLGYQVQGFKH